MEHALGIQTKVMKECIPEHKKSSCILISRIYVSIWIMIIGLSIFSNSFLPVFLFLIPKFFATLNIVWGLTQHMGLQEDVKDHRLSTRSVRLNPIFSFIYWKMEYHIEHHMFPSVPSYNLPKLHEAIKQQLPKPQTLFEAYKDIIPAVIKKTLVMLAPVYIKNIDDSDAPINAANTQKVVCALAADIFAIPKLI